MPQREGEPRRRVLIVDDVEMNRKLLRVQLRNEGFETVEAGDGVEALAFLKRDQIDAIVSDILMPNMDGYRLCAEVRTAPNLRKIPFVVYSATYISPSDEQLALEAGADRYFRKPYDLSALIEAVRELTEKTRHEVPSSKREIEVTRPMRSYDENLIRTLLERVERLSESERRYRRITIRVFRTLGRGAAAVLYGSGVDAGLEAYDYIQGLWKPDNDDGFVRAFVAYAKLSGLGDIREMRVDRKRLEIRVTVHGAFEASIHQSSPTPTCHFLRGILAGLGTRLFDGQAMDCRESTCRASGSPRCEFIAARLLSSRAVS